ncbi:serine carboxypeptidase-like 40 [Alnus glutinosa]|uniref:serine carboxypeptidase-like 40 n=1 Tax=Alnus glutinosa TaxID=3517 RepID=UPI002D78F434|nr:serine carboxypeptidase-like 40 [Alnus glutinosa]
MESSRPFCWLLLAFLILSSSFVAQTHGRMKEQCPLYRYKATLLKPDFGVDTSDFKVIEHGINETNVYPQEGFKEKDRIERLPGQPPVNFSQYGGYITVNKSAGRALYYYFVEAQQPNGKLPLLLWLNGGIYIHPGFSSLGYGAMQELGPFRVHNDSKTLFTNKFSWNHVANVLFLESPAGVGFSFSNTTSDYNNTGDRSTTTDNYVFLVNWFERFPEYKNRTFYISGRDYAGHHVPQLAQTILYHNKKANKTIINLKGIIIGNAVINDETDIKGTYDNLAGHVFASDLEASQIQKYCGFSLNASRRSPECTAAIDAVEGDIANGLDLYNLYAPICFPKGDTVQHIEASVLEFADPCSFDYVYAYLNRPDVQEALHANVTKLTHDWDICSSFIKKWKDSPSTVIPLLRELMANGLRVWIYSGDLDGTVSFTSTKYSINSMKLPVKNDWSPWAYFAEVGGYTEEYEGGLNFVTVRLAGQQVPKDQPGKAFVLIKHFLDGTPLPVLVQN